MGQPGAHIFLAVKNKVMVPTPLNPGLGFCLTIPPPADFKSNFPHFHGELPAGRMLERRFPMPQVWEMLAVNDTTSGMTVSLLSLTGDYTSEPKEKHFP